ncbi:MAG: hypothetical protein ABIR47_02800 [Candidatus Kapaibacterium sp.]
MELTDYLAILGLIAGGAYIVLAVIAFGRSRRRHADEEIERGRVVLNFEENELLEGEPTDDRMHKLAAICASLGKRVFAEDFDFTVESIARLDRAIMTGWGESDEDINPQVLFSFGAYVGEVLVRRTRGRWVSGMTESDPATVLFLGPNDDTVSVSPFMMVREKFDNMYKFDLSIAFTALEQKLKELKAA